MSKTYVNFNGEDYNRYFKDIRKSKLLTPEQEVELAKKIQEGDEKAIDELVNSNLKFVISIAKEYQGQGLSLSDLISEGNLGLVKAATRFDHTRGFRFISYAVWWVKQSIIQSLNDNSRTIRLPSNVITKISNMKKELGKMQLTEDKDITFDEMKNSENFVDMSKIPYCGSINEIINDNGNELHEVIEDKSIKKETSFYDVDERLKSEIDKALSKLSDREKDIIISYFGLNRELECMTLEAIGDKFGITKERVRQLKEKAIRKIRHNANGIFDALNE
jgi:RNA polymerase primary sigma factor